ncbi:unnamed protein product, partial [Didymodactylos carnosus]
MITYQYPKCTQIPGVNEINREDFHKMMLHRVNDYYQIKYACLLMNNECYAIYPNGVQYSRRRMTQLYGTEMTNIIFEFGNKFNELKLNNQEHALLFPIIVCNEDETLEDQETIRSIRVCYLYALYTQMCTTRKKEDAEILFEQLST